MEKINIIPAMTPPEVHEYLEQIGQEWKQHAAIEIGCWLGASSAALLRGLVKAGYDQPFYAVDKWIANNGQLEKAKEFDYTLKQGGNTQVIYLTNTKPIYDNIITYKGNAERVIPKLPKIEICIIDGPKKNPSFRNVIRLVSRSWVKGAIIGLLDYSNSVDKFYDDIIDFVKVNSDKFEPLRTWPGLCSCAFFMYKGGKLKL